MGSVKLIEHSSWDLGKSAYEELDELPFMKGIWPIIGIVVAYLIIIIKILPDYMNKREPFKLKNTIIFYNVIQVAISLAIFYTQTKGIIDLGGLAPKKCYMNDPAHRRQIHFGVWIYFVAKVSELLDTVFFVLRKKYNQVTFLHLYHHSSMVFVTWALLKYFPSHNLMFITSANSLVHVIMYTYYALAAMGPEVAKYLTWKKYITTMQMTQFALIILHWSISSYRSECASNLAVVVFVALNTSFFLILFMQFYNKSYTKTKSNNNVSNGKIRSKIDENFTKNIKVN